MDPEGDGHVEGVALALQASMAILPEQVAPTVVIPQFREIYDKHFDFVYRSARRLGVHERALDDASQDVFLVVHRRLSDFEGRSSIKTWLYGITRRVAKDYRRRAGRKEQGLVPIEGLAIADSSPHDDAARRQAAQTLETILSALDESKSEVFVLAEIEQMTVPEISEALSLNLNTTYSRLRVARSEFEKAVARHLATIATTP